MLLTLLILLVVLVSCFSLIAKTGSRENEENSEETRETRTKRIDPHKYISTHETYSILTLEDTKRRMVPMLLRQALAATQESRSISSNLEREKLITEVITHPSRHGKNRAACTANDVKSDPPWNVMIKRIN